MALNANQIVDRYKLKTQLSNWRFIAITLLIMIMWSYFGGKGEISSSRSYIASARIDGVIFDDHYRNDMLKQLYEDNSIKALLLHINSPGGSFVGGQNLYSLLRKVATKKPVVVVMGEMATSGGYMAALGGDYIFAREGTLTGSIGVIFQSLNISKLTEAIGIEMQTFKTSIYKGMPNMWEGLTPEVKKELELSLQDSQEVFSNMVGKRRELDTNQLNAVANGRIYTGRQALKHGLVDALGGEEEAILWLKTKTNNKNLKIKIISLVEKVSKFDKLLNVISNVSATIETSLNRIII